MSEDNLPFPEVEESSNKSITKFSSNITKSEIKSKADIALSSVEEGNVDAIDMFIKTRALRDVCDEVIDGLKDKVSNKLFSIHKADRKFNGVELQLSEGSIKYGFSHSDEWRRLKDELDSASQKLKDYEKLMIIAIRTEVFDSSGVAVDPAVEVGGTSGVLKVVIPK